MSAVTRWWWVRHAPVTELEDRLYGQIDVACDTSDRERLAALAALLPAEAVWVTSHLKRTIETARALREAGAEASAPIVERDLAEQSFGRWQGLTWDEMEAAEPEAFAAFWKEPGSNAPPGGESFADVMTRCRRVIERLTGEHPGRDIVAVAHGGSIRAAVTVAFGLPPVRGLTITIDTLSLTRVEHVEWGLLRGRGGVWRVVGLNVPSR